MTLTKPRLFSNQGAWFCRTACSDGWIRTGFGRTPAEAYVDMRGLVARWLLRADV